MPSASNAATCAPSRSGSVNAAITGSEGKLPVTALGASMPLARPRRLLNQRIAPNEA